MENVERLDGFLAAIAARLPTRRHDGRLFAAGQGPTASKVLERRCSCPEVQ